MDNNKLPKSNRPYQVKRDGKWVTIPATPTQVRKYKKYIKKGVNK